METKLVTVSTKIEKQFAEKLKYIAKRRGMRFSSFVYNALMKAIEAAKRDCIIKD